MAMTFVLGFLAGMVPCAYMAGVVDGGDADFGERFSGALGCVCGGVVIGFIVVGVRALFWP